MSDHDFAEVCRKSFPIQEASQEGYQVFYPDGYISWSPKEVFDSAYREISHGETDLIK